MTIGVLALDIATSTGWALRDRTNALTSGVQVFALARGESPGMRFLRFRRWLVEVLTEPSTEPGQRTKAVDVIAYERAHHRGGAATAVCVGMATVMLEEAARLGIEVSPVATVTLKKHATGSGRAGKDEMIAAAKKRWGIADLNAASHDEADALCVLAWALDSIEVRS